MKTDEQVGHGVTHLCAEHERAFQKTESMVNDGASGIVLDMHKHFRGLIRRWFSLGYQSGKIAGRQEAIDEMAEKSELGWKDYMDNHTPQAAYHEGYVQHAARIKQLEYLKNTEMACCNVEECMATISQALANDDKAKEMSK